MKCGGGVWDPGASPMNAYGFVERAAIIIGCCLGPPTTAAVSFSMTPWLTPESSNPLVMDVMTPHHPKWIDGGKAPTDFDSPIPVPFVSVCGKFRVAVSWHGPVSEKAFLLGHARIRAAHRGTVRMGHRRQNEQRVWTTYFYCARFF